MSPFAAASLCLLLGAATLSDAQLDWQAPGPQPQGSAADLARQVEALNAQLVTTKNQLNHFERQLSTLLSQQQQPQQAQAVAPQQLMEPANQPQAAPAFEADRLSAFGLGQGGQLALQQPQQNFLSEGNPLLDAQQQQQQLQMHLQRQQQQQLQMQQLLQQQQQQQQQFSAQQQQQQLIQAQQAQAQQQQQPQAQAQPQQPSLVSSLVDQEPQQVQPQPQQALRARSFFRPSELGQQPPTTPSSPVEPSMEAPQQQQEPPMPSGAPTDMGPVHRPAPGNDDKFAIGLGVLSPGYTQKFGNTALDFNQDKNGFSFTLNNNGHTNQPQTVNKPAQ